MRSPARQLGDGAIRENRFTIFQQHEWLRCLGEEFIEDSLAAVGIHPRIHDHRFLFLEDVPFVFQRQNGANRAADKETRSHRRRQSEAIGGIALAELHFNALHRLPPEKRGKVFEDAFRHQADRFRMPVRRVFEAVVFLAFGTTQPAGSADQSLVIVWSGVFL